MRGLRWDTELVGLHTLISLLCIFICPLWCIDNGLIGGFGYSYHWFIVVDMGFVRLWDFSGYVELQYSYLDIVLEFACNDMKFNSGC